MDWHNDQRILNLFYVILNKLIKYKWPNEGLLLFRFISDFWLSLVNDKHLEEVKFCNYGITNFHQWKIDGMRYHHRAKIIIQHLRKIFQQNLMKFLSWWTVWHHQTAFKQNKCCRINPNKLYKPVLKPVAISFNQLEANFVH